MTCAYHACLVLDAKHRARRTALAHAFDAVARHRTVAVRRSVVVPSSHANPHDLARWLRPLWFGGGHEVAMSAGGRDVHPVRVSADGETWVARA
jgi:hypothetical protein